MQTVGKHNETYAKCYNCSSYFEIKRWRKYCMVKCRQKAYRLRYADFKTLEEAQSVKKAMNV